MSIFTTKKLKLPKGFYDQFGEDLRRQRMVEAVFLQEGFGKGYQEIRTPVIEPEDALPREAFSVWNDRGFFTLDIIDYDSESKKIGSMKAVLRPEGTLPVCRFLAGEISRGRQLPIKLVYSITCYRNEPVDEIDGYKRREFSQLGVENIGNPSQEADVEVIEYGYGVLRKLGIPAEEIRIRLSDINIFKKLCSESEMSKEEQINIQKELDSFSKNRALGSQQAPNLGVVERLSPSLRDKWRQIFELYGPLQSDTKVDDGLYDLVLRLGKVGVPVTVDLAVVRGFNYYTGPVFQYDVYKDGRWNAEVGGGGRYDELIGQNLKTFGVERSVPATGFAFGTERVTQMARLPNGKYSVEMVI